jgi:hypothetical protein
LKAFGEVGPCQGERQLRRFVAGRLLVADANGRELIARVRGELDFVQRCDRVSRADLAGVDVIHAKVGVSDFPVFVAQ